MKLGAVALDCDGTIAEHRMATPRPPTATTPST